MKNVFIKSLWMLCCVLCFISCKDDDDVKREEYDPNKPVLLTSFSPDSGRIAEKILLDGENFGADPQKIKVYFNNKKAPVISSTGKRVYAIVPKMPGDTCTVSVVIGNDSLSYEQKFRYQISVSVSTVTGNGTATYKEGSLAEATLSPTYVCVDNEDNIFVSVRQNPYGIVKVSETENYVTTLIMGTGSVIIPNALCVDKHTEIITVPSEHSLTGFFTCDPKEAWAPRGRSFRIVETNGYPIPTNTWKHSMAACEYDGYVYTRFWEGQIIKINPKTYDAEIIYQTPNGTSSGLTFHSLQPKMLYFTGYSGGIANGLYSFDITDPGNTFKRLTASGSGHRDGELAISLLNYPWQIYFDPDGNLYIADCNNHCIRRVTTDNMMETVVGMPGTSGWKDGGKEEALFNQPRGVGVSNDGTVYVADWGNNRIRKLAIE
ncbi:MAG: IPT/TIG domain-containing protein [Bacteroidales bacterium]|nr:IPT/TIG domain-containing protein [Bacteroidales bacterium]